MKNNRLFILALGGMAASLTASAALLDSFDTFVAPGNGTRGFDLTSTGATESDNAGAGENIAGLPTSDTSYTSLTRRAWVTRTAGGGEATLYNTDGLLNWGNEPGVNSTASLRYNFAAPQNFFAQNVDQFEFVNGVPEAGITLTIDVFSASSPNYAGAYIQSVINNAFAVGNEYANVASFAGVNGGVVNSIWSSARTIVFTLSSPFTGRDVSIQEINLTTSIQVPEAKALIPAVAMAGFAGLMAWKRRASK